MKQLEIQTITVSEDYTMNEVVRKVKFYWFKSYKVFTISGKNIEEITVICHEICNRYHAIHFEIL